MKKKSKIFIAICIIAVIIAAAAILAAQTGGQSEDPAQGEKYTPVETNAPETETPAPESEISFDSAKKEEVTTSVVNGNGEEIVVPVSYYNGKYCVTPVDETNQQIGIYISETATEASPILLLVNNFGWQKNSYSGNYVEKYLSGKINSENPIAATIEKALEEGYVVVACGARGRSDDAINSAHQGHSPATIADVKAVIRYLRYNQEALPAGDTNKIVIMGASGGGGLAAIIGASGDSPDYYEYLYEMGAAGIDCVDGEYISTISDSVYAVMAICPISDFRYVDGAYEWVFAEARKNLLARGEIAYSPTVDMGSFFTAAPSLASEFGRYVDALQIPLANGGVLAKENLNTAVAGLMKEEISYVINTYGVSSAREDISGLKNPDVSSWLQIADDGSFTYNYDQHVLYAAKNYILKVTPAFSNYGMGYDEPRNEDTLFGSEADIYSPFCFYSWNNDAISGNGVGMDDTGLHWAAYLETEAGQALLQQLKMTSTIDYIVDENNGTTAPYWFLRSGMLDTDASVALDAVRYFALLNDDAAQNVNFRYLWMEGHTANYDIDAAFDWLAEYIK